MVVEPTRSILPRDEPDKEMQPESLEEVLDEVLPEQNRWTVVATWTVLAGRIAVRQLEYGNVVISHTAVHVSGDEPEMETLFRYTVMTGISGSTRFWKVQARDITTGAYSSLAARDSGNHWTSAFAAALEVHNVTSCFQFPSNGHVAFKNSVAAHGFPAYKAIPSGAWFGAFFPYGGPSCGFSVFPGRTSTLYW
jgi:hypothetical protein